MKQFVHGIPVIGPLAHLVYRKWISPPPPFPGSSSYWISRYESGGTSGDGSYNMLAEFKADILNEFVLKNKVKTVIEYGCGDGNQLKLSQYPFYLGFDVSPKAISTCRQIFRNDESKKFKLISEYQNETAELTLSLDVLFHLVEDEVFENYLHRLFDSSSQFVAIYSSDSSITPEGTAAHVKHRHFTKWVEGNKPEWQLLQHITNKHPFVGDSRTGSHSDFFIYGNTLTAELPVIIS